MGKEKAAVAALNDAPAGAPSNVACFKAILSPAVKKGATANIEVLSSYTDVMKPNPANIAQGEKQLLQFDGVASLLTPYSIEKATAEVSSHDQLPKLYIRNRKRTKCIMMSRSGLSNT